MKITMTRGSKGTEISFVPENDFDKAVSKELLTRPYTYNMLDKSWSSGELENGILFECKEREW